jgi:hypothetical protein
LENTASLDQKDEVIEARSIEKEISKSMNMPTIMDHEYANNYGS